MLPFVARGVHSPEEPAEGDDPCNHFPVHFKPSRLTLLTRVAAGPARHTAAAARCPHHTAGQKRVHVHTLVMCFCSTGRRSRLIERRDCSIPAAYTSVGGATPD